MKIFIHPYELEPLVHLNAVSKGTPRSGVLIRVEFSPGLSGYSLLQPWPEFGEPPLDRQLASMKAGKPAELGERALFLAHMDAKARVEGVNLLNGAEALRSHFLITNISEMDASDFDPTHPDSLPSRGFTHVKVKMGDDIEGETHRIVSLLSQSALKWRLDFSNTLRHHEFESWLQVFWPSLMGFVEFIEDPFPYEPVSWGAIRQSFRVPLAVDRLPPLFWTQAADFDFLVVKPSVQNDELLRRNFPQVKCVYTHNMDHGLGQSIAAALSLKALATNSSRIGGFGLLRSDLFRSDEFSKKLIHKGPFIFFPRDVGFGFTDLFEGLTWQAL